MRGVPSLSLQTPVASSAAAPELIRCMKPSFALPVGFQPVQRSCTDQGVTMEVVGVRVEDDTAQAWITLTGGTVDLAFLPAEDFLRVGGSAVLLADAPQPALTPEASDDPADWNGAEKLLLLAFACITLINLYLFVWHLVPKASLKEDKE